MHDFFQKFLSLRWKGGQIVCPLCGEHEIVRHGFRSHGSDFCYRRYYCRQCRKFFSDISGTFLEGSKIFFSTWFEAAKILKRDKHISVKKCADILKVSYPTALRVLTFLRKVSRVRELGMLTGILGRSEEVFFADALFEVVEIFENLVYSASVP